MIIKTVEGFIAPQIINKYNWPNIFNWHKLKNNSALHENFTTIYKTDKGPYADSTYKKCRITIEVF